jgi:uncharacterized membrane protein
MAHIATACDAVVMVRPAEAEQLAHRQTSRVEAFSDGVFAIAITLLALDLRVTNVEDVTAAGLARAVVDEWPAYFAFVLSFGTILIMWINHHARMAWVLRVDGLLVFSNGLVLLMIAALSFPTALVGEYLTGPAGKAAVATYALFVFGTSAAWNIFMYALKPERGLLRPDAPLDAVAATRRRVRFGLFFYASTAGLALVNAYLGLGLLVAMWVFWGTVAYGALNRSAGLPATHPDSAPTPHRARSRA